MGALILLIGFLMFLGGGILSAMQQDWAMIVLFLGILLLPIGAIVMYVQSRGPFQVVAIDDGWIRLKGVNPGFLAPLAGPGYRFAAPIACDADHDGAVRQLRKRIPLLCQ